MASVDEIAARLQQEDVRYVDNGDNSHMKTWKPNRKLVTSAVSGLVALLVFILVGPDADPAIASTVTMLVMTAVGYVVPLPEETE
jgi:hypothetical protein